MRFNEGDFTLEVLVFDDTAGPSGVLEVQRGDKLKVTVEFLHRRGGIHFELAAVERRRHVGEL